MDRRWPVRAVLLDIDDTLYPHSDFLVQAWDAVAGVGGQLGLDPVVLRLALTDAAAGGSDGGGSIDRALLAVGGGLDLLPLLLTAFQTFRPEVLQPYRGVANALDGLAGRVSLGIIADGHPPQQRAKLEALGVAELFDVVVCTDDLGRHHRKPDPLGFRLALSGMGAEPTGAVMIGDRPDKDIAGARAVGMHAIRVRQGEHLHQIDPSAITVDSTREALALIGERVGALR